MTNTLTSKRALVRQMIETAGGQFVGVTFVKKDGSVRDMLVQPATGKFRVVGDAASDSAKQAVETRKANHPNLLPIWDATNKAFRSINLDTVTEVRLGTNVVSFG